MLLANDGLISVSLSRERIKTVFEWQESLNEKKKIRFAFVLNNDVSLAVLAGLFRRYADTKLWRAVKGLAFATR